MERVNYQVEDRIAILTIQSPPVNALGTAVQEGLRDTAARAMHNCNVDAIVITGAGTMFVAGADIRELERMAYEGVVRPILPQLLLEIEAARKPLIAAIHGNALGGGLELALAAHAELRKQRRGFREPRQTFPPRKQFQLAVAEDSLRRPRRLTTVMLRTILSV